jgi:hypothetical protein
MLLRNPLSAGLDHEPTRVCHASATEAVLEMAQDPHRSGLLDDATYRQITLRHLGPQTLGAAQPCSGGG